VRRQIKKARNSRLENSEKTKISEEGIQDWKDEISEK
jgi:hypothetical protein